MEHFFTFSPPFMPSTHTWCLLFAAKTTLSRKFTPQAIFDGLITIDKHSFVEPELHKKLKKMPNGKKKEITKRIHRTIDYGALISANAIQVENSRYCWCITEDGIGFGAMCLLRKIYDAYQESGIILETAEFMI